MKVGNLETKYLDALLEYYPSERRGAVLKGDSGWNNTTLFVDGKGKRSVLRIYGSHQDRDRIVFEHAVLQSLHQMDFRYQVPVPVQTMIGDTVVRLEDGSNRLACMFDYIEGVRASKPLEAAYSFGEAAGELVQALEHCNIGLTPYYRPYYKLMESYPLCTRQVVLDFCNQPPEPFERFKSYLYILNESLEEISDQLDSLATLPMQLVHGDLNYSNLLVSKVDQTRVAALLDFEFCTRDLRVMEPAVIIAGLIGEGSLQQCATVDRFCAGLASKLKLMPEEVEAISLLMRLRHIDVFLHFLSRWIEGTDGPEVLQEQITSTANGIRQLESQRSWLKERFNYHF